MGVCDVCDKRRATATIISCGIETDVCDECRDSVPPGTRCECEDTTCRHIGRRLPNRCALEAVRYTVVRVPVKMFVPGRGWMPAGVQLHRVPMCEECAEYNEREKELCSDTTSK